MGYYYYRGLRLIMYWVIDLVSKYRWLDWV